MHAAPCLFRLLYPVSLYPGLVNHHSSPISYPVTRQLCPSICAFGYELEVRLQEVLGE